MEHAYSGHIGTEALLHFLPGIVCAARLACALTHCQCVANLSLDSLSISCAFSLGIASRFTEAAFTLLSIVSALGLIVLPTNLF